MLVAGERCGGARGDALVEAYRVLARAKCETYTRCFASHRLGWTDATGAIDLEQCTESAVARYEQYTLPLDLSIVASGFLDLDLSAYESCATACRTLACEAIDRTGD